MRSLGTSTGIRPLSNSNPQMDSLIQSGGLPSFINPSATPMQASAQDIQAAQAGTAPAPGFKPQSIPDDSQQGGQIWSPVNIGGININPLTALRSATQPGRQNLENQSADQLSQQQPILGAYGAIANSTPGKFIANAGAHATGAVGEGFGNLASAGGQLAGLVGDAGTALTGYQGFGQAGKAVSQAGQGAQQALKTLADNARTTAQQNTGEGADSASSQVGDVTGTLARILGTAALTPSMAGGLAKLSGASGAATTGAAGVANLLIDSPLSTAAQSVTNSGKLPSPQDLATGAGLDVAGLGLGKILEKIGQAGLAHIPQFTPSMKAKLGDAGLRRVGELMYDHLNQIPITTSRQAVGEALEPLKAKTYSTVSNLIDEAAQSGAGTTTIDSLMSNVKQAVISDTGAARAGLSLDEIPKALNKLDEIHSFYKNLYGDSELTLQQVQQLKKNLRYKTGVGADSLTSAANQFKEGVRSNAQQFIENQVGGTLGQDAQDALQGANKDYNVLKKTTDTLTNKAPYSGYLTDVVSGSAGAASALARGDIPAALGQAATAIGLKRLLTSAAPKIALAKLIKATPFSALPSIAKGIVALPANSQ